tara:strand:- start:1620 stop:1910 length:291 start_codon:yes stop_codon:yes gene_type:complete
MANAVELLVDLNKKINEASQDNDFSRLLFLDTKRRALIQSLATDPDFVSDETSLTILKYTAEQNQKLVADITKRMTALTQVTGNKIRMLRSYRMAK